MKATPLRLIVVFSAFACATLPGRADATSYAQLLKERDRVLSRIVAHQESKRPSGLADEDAIASAQFALYSFRRNVAATVTEKIKNQELVIRIFEKKQDYVKAKLSAGLVGDLQVLEATDQLLEAKQVLEELQLKEKEG